MRLAGGRFCPEGGAPLDPWAMLYGGAGPLTEPVPPGLWALGDREGPGSRDTTPRHKAGRPWKGAPLRSP